MIKLIASDVDGTLVKDGSGTINPEYYDVIRKLHDKGFIFCAASGRQFASIKRLFEPVSDIIYYICESGAVLRTCDEVLHVNTIPEADVVELLDDCRKLSETDRMVCTPDITYVESGDSPLYHFIKDSYHFDVEQVNSLNDVALDKIVKLSIFHNDNRVEEICGPTIVKKWSSRLQLVCAGTQWIDCISSETGKGNSLKLLQKKLNISPEETMVFGDNMNDLTMLKQAKYSYAIGNARDEVKEAAANVCDTYWNNGELKVLKSLL